MGGHNRYSSVPTPAHIPTDLELALARQTPVATRYDDQGKPIPPKGPQPMSAEAFAEAHQRQTLLLGSDPSPTGKDIARILGKR